MKKKKHLTKEASSLHLEEVSCSTFFSSHPTALAETRQKLQSLLLDPLELDLWRLLLRRAGDLFRRPRRLLLRPSLLELELVLDDLELELDDRLRRLRPLRELPPPREPSDDEALLLRRRLRPPLVRRLLLLPPPSEDDDDVDDEDDDRRRRRCDDDLFRPRLRLRDRERDDSDSSLSRRDVSLVVLAADREVLVDATAAFVTVAAGLFAACSALLLASLAWLMRSDLVVAEEDLATDGPLSTSSVFSGSLEEADSFEADDDCDADCDERSGCFCSVDFDVEGALCHRLLVDGGTCVTPDALEEPTLLHLTCDKGKELAVFRPDDISSGSTPGGRGSVGSSSCANGSLERRTAEAASSTAASVGPREGGACSSNFRDGRDIVVDPCCADEDAGAPFSEDERGAACLLIVADVAAPAPCFSARWFVSAGNFEAGFTEDDTLRV